MTRRIHPRALRRRRPAPTPPPEPAPEPAGLDYAAAMTVYDDVRREVGLLPAAPEPAPVRPPERGCVTTTYDLADLEALLAADGRDPAPAPEPETIPDPYLFPSGLPRERAAVLDALAESWRIQARIPGVGPDATQFVRAAPPPPPRPAVSPPAVVSDRAPDPGPPVLFPPHSPGVLEDGSPAATVVPAAQSPRVVRDWASRHDPRSRNFDVRGRLLQQVPIQDHLWEPGPVFDQGSTPPLSARDASGCVGMAVAAAANARRAAAAGPYVKFSQIDWLTKADGLALYDRAQDVFDHVTGRDYAGTSVLAGMKAGVEAGLFSGYLWAFGTRDVAQAVMQVGPLVIGVPWDTSLDDPDDHGVIRPGGTPNGGHALAVVGLVRGRGASRDVHFVLQQSRGVDHGDRGRVYLHHRHLAGLLAGVGEAAIPLPSVGVW